MSTTVTYKDSTIATVDNNTKTLTTQGKYLEANIVLTDVSGGGTPTLQSKTLNVSSAGTTTVTPDSGYDGLDEVEVNVPSANPLVACDYGYTGSGSNLKWQVNALAEISVEAGDTEGWLPDGYSKWGDPVVFNAIPDNTTITPTESAQTIGGADTMMEGAVTVAAISSNYVGSGITRRDSTDLSASGATVSVPSGYYASNASKAVASGTEGTPTATKGAVSNHAISVTPSVTNAAGYIWGGTRTGTAISVAASELVSGTLSISSSGTHDVTNYASASVAAGGATASATKGTVTNHSVTVTPSVTRTAGYITAGTSNGTAVTVSASELVSGSETKTANGTYDVTNLAEVVVDVPTGTTYTATITGTGNTDYCYINYNNTKYYSSGQSFTFSPGDTCSIYCTATRGGAIIYENGTIIVDGSGSGVASLQSYSLPSADVDFILSYGSESSTNINYTLATISITQNGTYDVTDYVSASVAVPTSGGSSNIVEGTFTTPTTAGAYSETFSYSGSGYPIAAMVFVDGGAYNTSISTWYNSVQRYAVGMWSMSKSVITSTPTYTTSGTQNQGVTCAIYKNSTSSSTSYTRTSAMNTNVYSSSNATNAAATCIRLKTGNVLSYYVNTSSYGLLPGLTYKYFIVYSS